MHYAAHATHPTTCYTAPELRLLPKHTAHKRPWGGYPHNAHEATCAWACELAIAEHKAAKRRAYEARLSTRLRKAWRAALRVVGL